MSKKNATKKTIVEIRAEYDSAMIELHRVYVPVIAEPVNPITGRAVNRDAEQVENLRYIAADLGWTDNRFAYAGQIRANGGKIRKGAYSVPSFFGGRYVPLYNFEDVEWEGGTVPTTWVLPERKPKATAPKEKKADKVKVSLNGLEVELTLDQLLELSKKMA